MTALVVAVAAVVAAVMALAFLGFGGDRLGAEPESIAHGEQIYSFEDAATMAVTADLVLRGKVVSIEPGRVVSPGEPDGFQYRAVTIRVDEVLRSADGTTPARVVLEEEGYEPNLPNFTEYDLNGEGYMVEGVPWSKVGDQGFYFLTASKDSDSFHLVSSQGRVLLGDGKLEPSGTSSLSALRSMSAAEVTTLVQQAERDLDAGLLKPQQPMSDSH